MYLLHVEYNMLYQKEKKNKPWKYLTFSMFICLKSLRPFELLFKNRRFRIVAFPHASMSDKTTAHDNINNSSKNEEDSKAESQISMCG